MGRLFDTRLVRGLAGEGPRARRIEEILSGRDAASDIAGFLASLAGELALAPAAERATELAILARVASFLYGHRDLEDDACVGFWADLVARLPERAGLLACYGDALLEAKRRPEAARALVAAVELEPSLLDDFADDVADIARAEGGEAWWRYQLAWLGAQLDSLERLGRDEPEDAPPSGDSPAEAIDIRECYSELLEEHGGSPDALARIRSLGERIARLETAGILPQSFVRRGSWRGPSR